MSKQTNKPSLSDVLQGITSDVVIPTASVFLTNPKLLEQDNLDNRVTLVLFSVINELRRIASDSKRNSNSLCAVATIAMQSISAMEASDFASKKIILLSDYSVVSINHIFNSREDAHVTLAVAEYVKDYFAKLTGRTVTLLSNDDGVTALAKTLDLKVEKVCKPPQGVIVNLQIEKKHQSAAAVNDLFSGLGGRLIFKKTWFQGNHVFATMPINTPCTIAIASNAEDDENIPVVYKGSSAHDLIFEPVDKHDIRRKIKKAGLDYFEPRDAAQWLFLHCFFDSTIKYLVVRGVSGSGKTRLVTTAAIVAILLNLYERVRAIPLLVSAAGQDVGYLKGSLDEKVNPVVAALRKRFDEALHASPKYCVDLMNKKHGNGKFKNGNGNGKKQGNGDAAKQDDAVVEDNYLTQWIADGTLSIFPALYDRGETYMHQVTILTEAQNAPLELVQLIVTRADYATSKTILEGDNEQKDVSVYGGLDALAHALTGTPEFFQICFEKSYRLGPLENFFHTAFQRIKQIV